MSESAGVDSVPKDTKTATEASHDVKLEAAADIKPNSEKRAQSSDSEGHDEENSQKETPTKRVKLEEPTEQELDTKIAKQLEYYFSDVNLIKDKFMLEQLEKNDNCVKLSVLATFTRLAQLTKDEDRMIQALKSFDSDFMEVDETNKQIRRKKPLPDKEEYCKQLDLRTVHISGFPDNITFEPLQNFCNKFGEVESLLMRRHFKTRQFKGCIHVAFKQAADAEKVMKEESLKFKDRDLRKESMEQYHKRKEEMKLKRTKARKGEGKIERDSS